MTDDLVKIEIIDGVAGASIYINDTRVAGSKPWGGGKTIYSFKANAVVVKDCLSTRKERLQVQKSADRIEQLEAALTHIWGYYPISVSNPRETIDAIRDFAFSALKEKKDV